MNDSYLNDEDYSGVQSEEDIKRILKDAQTPGPNKYNFDNAGHEVRVRAGRVSVCVPGSAGDDPGALRGALLPGRPDRVLLAGMWRPTVQACCMGCIGQRVIPSGS
jgi:hypothetical protein